MPYTKLKRVNSQILKNIIILQQSYDFNGLEVLMGGNVGSNTQDEDGKTLLMYKYILHCNRPNAKQFLSYFQPDITLQDHTGRTAADYARENGNHEDALFLYTKEIEASKLSPSKKQELKYRLYESYSKYGDIHKIKNLKNILQQFRGVPEDNFKVKTQANYEEIIERQQKQLQEALKGNGNRRILQKLANSECDFSKINLNAYPYIYFLFRDNVYIIQERQQKQLEEALQGNGDKQILQNLANSGYDFSKINLNVYPYNYFLSRDNVYIIQQRQQEQLEEALKGRGNTQIIQNLSNAECDFSKINLNSYQHLSEDNKKIVHERQQEQLEEALQGNGNKRILQNLVDSEFDFSRVNLNLYSHKFLSEDNKKIVQERQQKQLEEALQGNGDTQIIQNLAKSGCDFSRINLNSDSYQHLLGENKKIIRQRQQEQLEEVLQTNSSKEKLQILINFGCDFSRINLNSDSYQHLSEENKKIIQEKQHEQLEEALKGNGNKRILQNLVDSEFDFSRVNLNLYSHKFLSKNNKEIVQKGKQKQLKKALQGNGDKRMLEILANFGCDFSRINLNSELYENLSKDNKRIIRQRQQIQLEEALRGNGNRRILQNLAKSGCDFSKINLKADSCVHLSEDNKKIVQKRQQEQAMEREQNTQQVSMQPIWRRNLGVCGTSSANQSQNTHLGQNHTIPGAQQPPAFPRSRNQGNQRGNGNSMGG